jgi:hypothetical protein
VYVIPIDFSEFKAKYNIVSPDNLGMDRVSFGESLKAYEEHVSLDYRGTTRHGTNNERVCEALLLEFVQYIMEQWPWLNKDLMQMVMAPDGTHVIPQQSS